MRAESSGQPLQGANVVLRDTAGVIQAATATDGDGFYQSSGVAPGRYRLQISFVGYAPFRDTLRLASGEQRTISVALSSAPAELEGVTVEGREPVEEARAGVQRIRTADIETIPTPGLGSDLSAYLRSLPSVTTIGDRGGRLYVRGGTPAQNLVLVDGIPLYKPFHIIGFYSSIPGGLVSNASFYAGGFGAEYMESLSSVLDVRLRAGNTEGYEGSVGVGPFLASAHVEGPVQQGTSSFLVHARHSLIERTGPSLLGQEAPYEFYDVTAKAHHQSESSQCSFVGNRTYDRGRIDPNRSASFRWSNTALGGKCLVFGSTSAQVLDTTFGTTRFRNSVLSPDGTERTANTWRIYTTFTLEQPTSWGPPLTWSAKVRADKYGLQLDETFLGIENENWFLITTATHLETEWEWGNALTVEPSVGAQVPLSWERPSVEPRLRLSYQQDSSSDWTLTAAGGLYRQFVTGVTDERDAGSTFQALVPTPFENRPLQATHALLGWNQRLLSTLHFSVEGWYKRLHNLPVPRWTPIVRFSTDLARADGRAFGADVSVQYEQNPLRLDVTYGYGQTTYWAPREDIGAWTGDSRFEYAPPHDLRHKFGVTAAVNMDWLSASLRWQYSSGLPFTRVYGFDTMLQLRGLRNWPSETVGIPRAFYRQPYGARLPSYHRLDVSLEHTFDLGPSMQLSAAAGAMNAYNRANVFYVDISSLDRVDQLPIIPYLSLEVGIQ